MVRQASPSLVSRRIRRLLATAAAIVAVVGFTPRLAGADIVRLTNGRIMNVEKAVFDGNFVIFHLHGGGEIKTSKDIVAELLPDEVPYARAVAIEALAASVVTTGARLTRDAISALIDRVAERVGLDRRLAHAVVRAESNYNPEAISSKGAMGLMQLMPVLARQYALADPFHPEQNLEAGMRHLRHLLGRYDLSRALAAYNAGEGAVAKYGGVPPYRETQEYVRKIRAMLQ
jgi:soluble lytic murein transglycosylase-like protein